MKCIFDFTTCSIPEGYTKNIKIFNLFLIMLILFIFGILIKSKLFVISGMIFFIILLIIIINHRLDIFLLPKFKKPKKIDTNHKHILRLY